MKVVIFIKLHEYDVQRKMYKECINMIDITKEEFWDNKYEEVSKTEKRTNRVTEFVTKHKIITVLLVSLGLLITANTILIYNFFKILETI